MHLFLLEIFSNLLTHLHLQMIKMRTLYTFPLLLLALLFGLIEHATAQTVTHGEGFVPNAVLRVTEESRKQSCVPQKDILVVNGTSPGPRLSFVEGKTVWIRVYNDIPHQNLTMVSYLTTPLRPLCHLLNRCGRRMRTLTLIENSC